MKLGDLTTGRRRFGSRWVLSVAALCVVGLSVAVVGVLVALSRSGESDVRAGSRGAEATANRGEREVIYAPTEELYSFESVEEMSSASDLVVEGTVDEMRSGRRIEEEPGSFVEYDEAVISVDTLLASADGSAPQAVVLEQQVRAGGQPIVAEGRDPVSQGDHVLVFLKRVDPSLNDSGEVTYVVINSQALYQVADDGSLEGPETGDPLVAQVEAMGMSGVEDEVG